jgi:hypoxanthine phosphoribosyltransferase
LLDLLQAQAPASLQVCTLLNKPSRRRVEVPLDFVGFEIPDRFVVGYGLDAAQRYRNLSYLAVVDQ